MSDLRTRSRLLKGTVAFRDANGDIDIDRLFQEYTGKQLIDYVFKNFPSNTSTGPIKLPKEWDIPLIR